MQPHVAHISAPTRADVLPAPARAGCGARRLRPASARGRVRALAPALSALAVTLAACAGAPPPRGEPILGAEVDTARHRIRINQLGYLPDAPKVAVLCALEPRTFETFHVVDHHTGHTVLGPLPVKAGGPFGPCVEAYRLDFTELREEGEYRLVAGSAVSPRLRIGRDVYRGAADVLLAYLRQQRSGFNPFFRDSVHHRTDGILVDHPTREGEFIPVAGGWADAADYLQYVTTSANATFLLMQAWRDHPEAFGDEYDARGLPGANGIPDVLDEARHGLEWLVRMYPEDDLMLNQLADDRDHSYLDLPTTDSSDYGWGKGSYRPVYPCTGKPQGLFGNKNRSNGMASTAGKYAAAFALGAVIWAERDPEFAAVLRRKAIAAYELGLRYPGVCQTAPGVSPYFYEEDNWTDDMELGAAMLHALTGEERYLRDAMGFARREPVTPWMGQDTANHYQWYPWHNNGHYETWRQLPDGHERQLLATFYRWGLRNVVERADNGFRVGIPFIWCSNNLMASFATQALHYRRMTGDTSFIEYEFAALDWLFGTNPWGVSMVIGLPEDGTWPRDPHSVVAMHYGPLSQRGGLVDGPVYRSIFESLRGVRLRDEDEYAAFNTGHIVYHDDMGDYSTNEPIMDGTANLAYLLSALALGSAAVHSAP
jgi:endoglucanase